MRLMIIYLFTESSQPFANLPSLYGCIEGKHMYTLRRNASERPALSPSKKLLTIF
jgi:hypothetical protein